MTKKHLLVILLFIFLCACSYVQMQDKDKESSLSEQDLLQKVDDVVKKATLYSHQNGEDVSVFQNTEENLWKIEFEDGLIILYDEKTDELTTLN